LRRAGKRERRRAMTTAAALVLGVAIAAAVKAEPTRADENDTLFKAVNDLCVNHSGTVDAIATKALNMPFEAFNYGSEKEGYYGRQIGLKKLGSGGTVVIFYAKSKRAPVNECHFASYSDDVADMAQRLRTAFDLSEPAPQSASVQLKSRGEKTIAGKQMKFELEHGFGPNQRSGAFSFTVNR
jgi:hypothetical protein